MDLVNAACNLQQASSIGKIQIAVAKKILDAQQANGNAALKLLEAAQTGVSTAGDQLTAAATGLGANLDVYG